MLKIYDAIILWLWGHAPAKIENAVIQFLYYSTKNEATDNKREYTWLLLS